MKKKIFAMAVMAICISILASTTLAYFTDVGTAENVITAGGIRIAVVEQQLVGGVLEDYPDAPIPAMPGRTVSKIVSVKNSEQPAWIRIRYEVTVYDAAGAAMEVPAEELEQLLLIQPDAEAWTFQDGWWYYNEALGTGDSTTPLFEAVQFAGSMGNEYQNSTVIIDVQAQAVQQANNGATVLDAAGWPED